ncbi:MAG: hypothetical protein ACRD1X_00815 [Vicinamibacteria bacterium]
MGILAATLGLLLQSSDPEYPLGRLRFPALTEPADPVSLVDLNYQFSQDGSVVQSFESRIRLHSFAFVSGEIRDQRRGAFFNTERIDIGVTEENGRYVLEGGYRAPRWLMRGRAERRPRVTPLPGAASGEENGGWVLDTRWALRLNPDFEILLDLLGDTATSTTFPTRPLRRGGLGFLYQRGNHLEMFTNLSRSRIRTEGGLEYDLGRAEAGVLYYRRAFELESVFAWTESNGPLGSSEGFATLRLTAELGRHLVATASTANRWEPGVKRFEQDLRAGITLFARQHHFFRDGEVGRRVLALTRRAYELGYNERRIYDLDGLRALRERLSLSVRAEELAADLDELYRAEVRERNVPHVGVELGQSSNDIVGMEAWSYRVLAAVPWPVDWPFLRDEDAVDFVRVEYLQEELEFTANLTTHRRELTVEAALNREITARFRWIDPARTPDDVSLFETRPSRIELEFDYTFGR